MCTSGGRELALGPVPLQVSLSPFNLEACSLMARNPMPNQPRDLWHDPTQSYVRQLPTPVTLLLLTSLGVTFSAQLGAATPDELWHAYQHYALTLYGFSDGQYSQLITYAWMHAVESPLPMHLLINCALLLILGPPVERRLGSLGLVLIFFGGVVAGGIGFLMWAPLDQMLVGASAGIYALLGAAGMVYPHLRLFRFVRQGIKLRHLVWVALIIQLVFLVTDCFPQISHESHLAGGLFGVVAGIICRNLLPVREVESGA